MNSVHALTAENLLRALPEVLRNDESMAALAASVAQVLAQRPEEIQRLAIYPRIDELPEELLDILAYDFKVDWWDGDYTLEEKRRTLKDSWSVHRMLGTKAAVELAISSIYPGARVIEWFEYDGAPYHFKLKIDVATEDTSSERHRRVLERVRFYKNLRSHLDEIIYIIQAEGVATGHTAAAGTGRYLRTAASVQNSGEVGPPHIPTKTASGACASGRYLRVTTSVQISGKVGAPQIPTEISTGVRVSGAYASYQVRIAVDHIGWPRRELPIYTDVRVSETYISTSAEVPTEVSP